MLYNRILQKLDDYKSRKLLRNKKTINHKNINQLSIGDKQLLSFTSNDYLCLSQNYDFVSNLNECVENYGTGSVSSALISGFFNVHKDLLDEWYEDTIHHLEISDVYADSGYYPADFTACNNYGGCKFRETCSHSGNQRDMFFEEDFRQQLHADLEETKPMTLEVIDGGTK